MTRARARTLGGPKRRALEPMKIADKLPTAGSSTCHYTITVTVQRPGSQPMVLDFKGPNFGARRPKDSCCRGEAEASNLLDHDHHGQRVGPWGDMNAAKSVDLSERSEA